MRTLYVLFFVSLTSFAIAQNWKAAATEAIQQHRMAPVRILLEGDYEDSIRVQVKMREHAFKWGTTINIAEVTDLKQNGIHPSSDHPYYTHFRHFNSVTPENAGKWKGWLNPATRATYLEMATWLDSLDIANRGHTSIWSSVTRWNAVPDFVVNANAEVVNGTVVRIKNEVIRDYIQMHLESQLPILAGYGVYELDLINELLNEGEIVRLLMELPTVERAAEHAQWHRWAKEAAPEVDLIVNEYNLFQSGNNFHERFVQYVRDMLAADAPIDGIGMQGHFFGPVPNYEELKRRLAEVAVLGLPMSVTEFDMEQDRYDDMERVLYAVFSEPLVSGFSFWGAWDGQQWRGNAPMFEEDWSLKPSGRAWFDLVKESWWTDTTLQISNTDQVSIDGFLGTYEVYLEKDGRVISQSFDLGSEGETLMLDLDEMGYLLPEARLELEGDRTTIFVNEPLQLTIDSNSPIEEIIFKDGDCILGIDSAAYVFSSQRAGTFQLNAEITFQNGYHLETTAIEVDVSSANSAPVIRDVFPSSGANLLQQEQIEVFVNADDSDNDPIEAMLLNSNGDTLAISSEAPFYFVLTDLLLGSNTLQLRVVDDRFGFDERTLLFNIINPTQSNLITARPLAADDDIEEKDDGTIDVEGDLDLGEKLTGIRFAFASIPPEAIVDSAFVQFSSQKAEQDGETRIRIQAEKSTNSNALNSARGNLAARQRTQAVVDWSPATWEGVGDKSDVQRTPDLSAVIVELLAQDGWTTSSPVHILADFEAGFSKRSAFSFDQSPADAPALQVHYRLAVDAAAPPAPDGLFYTSFGGNNGQLTWETPTTEDIQGYIIFIEGISNPIFVEDPSYLFFNLEEGQEYVVRIQAIGQLGLKSALSDAFVFQPDVTTSAYTISEAELYVYPNPVTTQVFIHSERTDLQLRLFDRSGQEFAVTSRNNVVTVAHLPSGIYYLSIRQGEQRTVRQFVVQR
jgi:GH35 family endo-1,4-beta-xylanase